LRKAPTAAQNWRGQSGRWPGRIRLRKKRRLGCPKPGPKCPSSVRSFGPIVHRGRSAPIRQKSGKRRGAGRVPVLGFVVIENR